jgi:uncharacterized membrane protein (DUF485 family)
VSTTQIAQDGNRVGGGAVGAGTAGPTYADIQRGKEFVRLRRSFRRFVFPVTALFLAWYFLYVVLAAFAPDFMGTPVFGKVNIGLLFGLGQFASTFVITMVYVRWADQKFDPTAERLRGHMEDGYRGADRRGAPAEAPAAAEAPAPLDGGEPR